MKFEILKPLLLIYFIILYSSLCFSQSEKELEFYARLNFYQKQIDSIIINSKLNDSLSNYYKNIYKAEEYIMKGKYSKASAMYEEAFKHKECPFITDIHGIIACELKQCVNSEYFKYNTDKLKKYIYLGLKKGGNKDWYLNSEKYKELFYGSGIIQMVDTIQPTCDTSLIKYLKEILYDDQEIRTQARENNSDYYHDSEWGRRINKVDSINYHKLSDIINNYPDFGEEAFGSSWYNISIIFLHNKNKLDLYIRLHELVMNGDIDARDFDKCLANSLFIIQNEIQCLGEHNFNYLASPEKIYVYSKIPRKELKVLNKYRKKIFLTDINSYHKRYLHGLRSNNDSALIPVKILCGEKEDLYDHIINKKDHFDREIKIYYKDNAQKKRLKREAKEYKKSNKV